MAEHGDELARQIARSLGVVQEAKRLGHRRVGTEHVLIASFGDPVVRWALKGAGCDLRDVQTLVTRASKARNTEPSDDVVLTDEARDVLSRATRAVPDFSHDRDRAPAMHSQALGSLMITLLHDEQDTAARRILDDFGVREHAPSLTAVIQQNAGMFEPPRGD